MIGQLDSDYQYIDSQEQGTTLTNGNISGPAAQCTRVHWHFSGNLGPDGLVIQSV